MNDKRDIRKPGLDTEEPKELELGEQSKLDRKVSYPATLISYNAEASTNDRKKVKGR